MDDFKHIASGMSKSIKELQKMNERALNKIKEHEPEKVAELLKDNNALKEAFERKDLDEILNIQRKYADKNNK